MKAYNTISQNFQTLTAVYFPKIPKNLTYYRCIMKKSVIQISIEG